MFVDQKGEIGMSNNMFHTYQSGLVKDATKFLFYLLIALLPYDAFNLLPSTYRPISLFPLTALFFLVLPKLIKSKIDSPTKFLGIFFLCSIIYSILIYTIHSLNYSLFFDFLTTTTIGVILFLTANIIFKQLKIEKVKNYKGVFANMIAKTYIFPIIVAGIDMLSVYSILPISVSEGIHIFFGGFQYGRICGVTYEASWLSMHLIFAGMSYIYLIYLGRKKLWIKFLLLLDVLILLASVSFQGYIYIILIILFCLFQTLRKQRIGHAIIFLSITISIVLIITSVLSNIDSDLYFISRFKNLSLGNLLHSDLSAFVRVINPICAILMFFNNFGFGVGGGAYPIYYGDYINRYFDWGLLFYNGQNEIVQTILTTSASAKCLWARLVGEFGLISFLYFFFIITVISRRKTDRVMHIWLFAMLVLMLQFDSMCYFPLIIFLAFYNNLEKRTKRRCPSIIKQEVNHNSI